MTPRHAHQRGFAFMLSIALIIMLGMALAAMSSLLGTEIRRTRRQTSDAQMRQLLTAGTRAAQSHLEDHDRALAEVDVHLPATLPDARLLLRIGGGPDATRARAEVRAVLGGDRARQTVTFRHDGTGWPIQAASYGN